MCSNYNFWYLILIQKRCHHKYSRPSQYRQPILQQRPPQQTTNLLTAGFQPSGPVAHKEDGAVLVPQYPTCLGSSPVDSKDEGWWLGVVFGKVMTTFSDPTATVWVKKVKRSRMCSTTERKTKKAALFSYVFWFVITRLWFTSPGITVWTTPANPWKYKQRYQQQVQPQQKLFTFPLPDF